MLECPLMLLFNNLNIKKYKLVIVNLFKKKSSKMEMTEKKGLNSNDNLGRMCFFLEFI